jgi:hypothetical protein
MAERVRLQPRGVGQPTKYDPDIMPNAAKFMAQRGAILSEIADAFKVSTQTIANWRNKYPEFRDAIQIGVDTFNPRVERALAERAIGFWVTIKEEVRDEKTGKIIQPEVRKYFPPDVTAIIFFLKNRMRDKWRDVYEQAQKHELKSSAEIMVEIRKDLQELQDEGYLQDLALPAPNKKKIKGSSGNGHG